MSSASLLSVANVDATGVNETQGVAYMLPAQYARIAVIREKVDDKKLKEQLSKAEADSKAADVKLKAAQDAEKDAGERLAAFAPGPAKEDFAKQYELFKADLKVAKTRSDKAAAAVTKAEAAVAGANGATFVDKLTLSLDPLVGDSRFQFVAKFDHQAANDDTWIVKTTAAGLLSSADSSSKNNYGEILVELSRLAGTALSNSAPNKVLEGTRDGTSASIAPYGPFKYEQVFDVTDANVGASYDKINKELSALDVPFELHVSALGNPGQGPVNVSTKNIPIRGLAYRRPLPYAVEVWSCATRVNQPACNMSTGKKIVAQTFVVSVPNKSRIEVVPYENAPFVLTKTNTAFTDGMLVSADVTKPSELIEMVRIPGKMIEAVGKSLREVSPIQVDYSNKQKDAASAEAALYDAQRKALEAKAAYDKAQAAATTPP